MKRKEYDKLITDCGKDLAGDFLNGLPDNIEYDIAENLLSDDKELEKFMKNTLNITDYKGRLGDDLYNAYKKSI